MQNLKCYIFTPADHKERRIAEGYGATQPEGTVEIFTDAWTPLDNFTDPVKAALDHKMALAEQEERDQLIANA